jgi:hypothetical protein
VRVCGGVGEGGQAGFQWPSAGLSLHPPPIVQLGAAGQTGAGAGAGAGARARAEEAVRGASLLVRLYVPLPGAAMRAAAASLGALVDVVEAPARDSQHAAPKHTHTASPLHLTTGPQPPAASVQPTPGTPDPIDSLIPFAEGPPPLCSLV